MHRTTLTGHGPSWTRRRLTTSFVVAGVADDGDVGAFIGSAVVILALSLLLWKLGMWFALRRTDQRSG